MKKSFEKKLRLHRETISALTHEEIVQVAGGTFTCLRSCYAPCHTDEYTACKPCEYLA